MPLPMPSARAGHADTQVLVDINTTPLIDVMLVLLIMLIITIPLQLDSVNLNMPTPSAQPPQTVPDAVQLRIAADGSVRWNAQVVPDGDALQEHMRDIAAQQNAPELHIRPDQQVAYRHVAAVLAAAQRAGLSKMGIVSQQAQP